MGINHSDGDTYPLQVVFEVDSHDALRELLRTVKRAGIDATTATISPATLSEATSVTIDLDVLTDKQRDTLELAISEGYYERPRETDLTTLADRLGLSKSAVSQRLRNAETNLVTNALDVYR